MQQVPILQTKLHIPPVRPESVSRPRLIQRLNAGLDRKLTLISAPAGFGKTTLVSEWVDDLRRRAANESQIACGIIWLSLDERDNDLTRFLAYFVAALAEAEAIDSSVGGRALGMLHASQAQSPPAEALLTYLINEIAATPYRILFVLDDYHLINAQPIHDTLTFLLQHLSPHMHLVIATREDPHLPLARLRARGQLTELRATDLRFSLSEAAELFNQVMGLDLSAEDIAALETRTEGWIAGLQLAAVALQGTFFTQGHQDVTGFIKSFTGSHRFVLDYLMEEVLEQQSESIQTFLQQTSILDRLCGPLCDAVRFGIDEHRGSSEGTAGNSQVLLVMLERANLFIVALDEERRWYRYHHLFADLLRQRQTQLEEVPMLHRRASAWYERNGFADEAIEHALCAEEFERAARLIEQHVDAMWQRGEHLTLRRWLARLPVELIFSRPHLCILHAWDLFTRGQHDAAEQSLQAAERALGPATHDATKPLPMEQDLLGGSQISQVRGRVAAIRAFLASYQGDLAGTIQYAGEALEHLPEQDPNWRGTAAIALGDAYSLSGELAAAYRARLQAVDASKAGGNLSMIANLKLADTHRQQGQLRRTMEICRQQWDLAQEMRMSQTVVAGWLLALWGETLAELNDLDRALRQAKKGVRLTERGKDVMVIGWSNLCLIRVLFSRGEIASVDKVLRKMENLARNYAVPPFITNPMSAWQARIWLAQGNLDAASLWVAEGVLDAESGSTLLHEMEYLALARVLIAQGRSAEAVRLLQGLLETAEAGQHTARAIEALMLQALAFQAGSEPTRALTTLERALILAEPGGFVRVFVDEGPPMAHLLYEAAAGGVVPEYARRLVAAFPIAEPEQAGTSETRTPETDLVEPLSERELEVLQLLAAGLTNGEIATRLFVSLNTVKAHTRNVYGKLGVHSRTRAVVRAREVGLLPRWRV